MHCIASRFPFKRSFYRHVLHDSPVYILVISYLTYTLILYVYYDIFGSIRLPNKLIIDLNRRATLTRGRGLKPITENCYPNHDDKKKMRFSLLKTSSNGFFTSNKCNIYILICIVLMSFVMMGVIHTIKLNSTFNIYSNSNAILLLYNTKAL